jgi:integrase
MCVTQCVTEGPRMPLRPEQVASAIKSGATAKISDGRSLYLVTRNGRGYWVLQYREGASFRSQGLGSAAKVTPAAARRARDAFMLYRHNAALMIKPAPVAGMPVQAPAAVAAKPFGEVHLAYRTNHAAEWSKRQQVQIARLFKNHTRQLDPLPVDSITVDQVAEVLRPIWRGPSAGQGARLRQLLEHVFRAAKVSSNPASWDGLRDVLSKKTIKAKPHASMSPEEMPAFMAELSTAKLLQRKHAAGRPVSTSADDYDTISRCLRFCILTAARSGEAIGADWSEIDMVKKLWTIPAERMKMDEPHVVPLSDAAIALLGIPNRRGRVFAVSSTGTGAINKDGLYKHLMNFRSGLTVHGFRSTFATWAEDAGHKPNVIEAALAHEKGDATTRAYLRSKLLPARRKLADDWASYACSTNLERAISPTAEMWVEGAPNARDHS